MEPGRRRRVVERCNVPAELALATADRGILPWVPLMRAVEPPDSVIGRGREVIDQHALADDHDRLIAVTEVFTRLRYRENSDLLSILGTRI